MPTADAIQWCLEALPHSRSVGDVSPEFVQMWQVATHALQTEDLVLRGALTSGNERFPEGYKNASRGLAYWVFETGLVYTVFKAWAPMMVTRWEHRYGDAKGKLADLVLFPSATEGWVIEAKWFNSNSATVQKIFLSDVEKLRKANGFPKMTHPFAKPETACGWRRFLMTFSWGDSMNLTDEWEPFDEFIDKQTGLSVVCVAAFPSHVYKDWGSQQANPKEIETGYFAMTMVEVEDADPE